jgi:ubiquinone/menaquinone biosynthesis C-methylase UbiE
MTLAHERYVGSRFDALESRFHEAVSADDYRLRACVEALGPLDGRRILDLGCGKGRFARRLEEQGAEVVGLDGSRKMLAGATGLDRARGSALRLPFTSGKFDGAMAVEVFEHLPPGRVEVALAEIARVLKAGGRLAIVDKNRFALDSARPWLPKLAVKTLDERRGRWMYPAGGPVREHWFSPRRFAEQIRGRFEDVATEFLLAPEESRRAIFRLVPRARLMVLWSARAAGGAR